MKRIIFNTFGFLLTLLFLSYSNVYANSFAKNDILNTNEYLNPDYINYMNLSEEERSKYNVIPEKYIVDYEVKKENLLNIPKANSFYDYASISAYPSSYDLRTENVITPLKNQGQLGLCWAFAAVSSIESNLVKKGIVNISNPAIFAERQMDYISATPINNDTFIGETGVRVISEGVNPYNIDRELGSGGNFSYASIYFSSGITPVIQSGDWSTYFTNSKTMTMKQVLDNNNTSYYVTDFVNFPFLNMLSASSSAKESWREQVKNHIVNYGSVAAITIAPNYVLNGNVINSNSGSCAIYDSNTSNFVLNDNGDCGAGYPSGLHAMSIIGWDDNYTFSYCDKGNTSVTNLTQTSCVSSGFKYITINGAWILKNSWGNETSYPFLAYDSYVYSANGVVSTSTKDWTNNYDEIDAYEYQFKNNESITTYKKSDLIDEKIKRIEFKHSTQNKTYNVYISPKNDENYTLIKTGTTSLPGMVSVPILDDIILDEDSFSIKVSLQDNTEAKNIYAFTTDVTPSSNTFVDSNIELKNEIVQNRKNYYYEINSVLRNIETGSIISYETYNSKGQKVSSVFPDAAAYVINDSAYTTIDFSEYVPVDTYIIKTIYNGNVIETNEIQLGAGISGDGSSANPYMISTASDLASINKTEYNLNKNYKLKNNIDMSSLFSSEGICYNDGKGWDAIGTESMPFAGTFNGNGFYISNLMINRPMTKYLGLFGYAKNSTIKNLGLLSVNANVGRYSAALVGYIDNTLIDQVYVLGNVTSNSLIGGVVGYMQNASSISNSFYNGNITGLGISYESFINETRSNSLVDDSYYAGSICNRSSIDGPCTKTTTYGIVYIQDNTSIFENKSLYDLKTLGTYSMFNFTSIWEIKNIGALPTLRNVPYIYIASFDADDLVVFKNNTKPITTNMNPINPSQNKVKYVSSNETIASVNSDGVVTGNEYGNVTISIVADDGSFVSQNINAQVTDEYVVSFYNEDGSKIKDQTVLRGENITFDGTIPTKQSTEELIYEFDKWVTTQGGTEEADLTNITSNRSVYASFKVTNAFLVTFKNYDGSTIKTEYVTYGQNATPPINPTRTGYTFKEWNTKTDGTGTIYSNGQLINVTDNLILYAQWEKNWDFRINTYSYDEINKYIDFIAVNTIVPDFTQNIVLNTDYTLSVDYKTINNKQVLYTGGKTKIFKNGSPYIELTNIVRGDVNGNGQIDIIDYIRIKKDIMDTEKLNGIYIKSADMNNNNSIDIIDYIRIKKIIMEGN